MVNQTNKKFLLDVSVFPDQAELVKVLCDSIGGKIVRESSGVNYLANAPSLKIFTIELENRFTKKVTMSQANRFMHFMWRHVLKMDGQPPRVTYSVQEMKIREARKAWRSAMQTAEDLRMKYLETKGDFFKR